MRTVCHIVFRDKFTSGYINFMKLNFKEYTNIFLVRNKGFDLKLTNENNVFYYDSSRDIIKNRVIRNYMYKCDKIIVSGVFGGEMMFFYSPVLLRKAYFHFWGGDFYSLREKEACSLKGRLHNIVKKEIIRHCKAYINLIKDDYDELVKIVKKEKKHFVAPMPGDPLKPIDYDWIMRETEPNKVCRIIIGNSATDSNHHIEVFEMLKHLKKEDIEIICPLSYGDERYRDLVTEKGRAIFGDKFVPLLDYMDKETYMRFLSSCDIAVFNNDRQQAMGNISLLLGFGKKVYMRSDTSMWKMFCEVGYSIYDIGRLKAVNIDELKENNSAEAERNITIRRKKRLAETKTAVESWSIILKD